MKKLHIFDSLKLVLAAVACVFILNVAHAATLPAGYTELGYIESTGTQWIDTGYILQSNDVIFEWSAKDLDDDGHTSLFGSEQSVSPKYSVILHGSKKTRTLYAGTGNTSGIYESNDSNFHSWVLSLTNDHTVTLYKDGTLVSSTTFSGGLQKAVSIAVFSNKGKGQYSKMALKSFVIKDNNIVTVNLVPARRDSDGVLGMYDLADPNPATAFHTNAGTGEFIAGPAVPIKIATTKYNEESFASVKTDLSAAVNAVEYVVSNTMIQAQQIDQIANEKQTRPDESCPPFKKCLLVEGEDGTPHWYEIYDPINDFLRPILVAAGLSDNQGAPIATWHDCTGTGGEPASGTCYDTANVFYKGNSEFRENYIDGAVYTRNRPFGPTTLPRCADNAKRSSSTQDAGICYDTGGMFRELTKGSDDDAGEWAIVYDDNEGGVSLGITPGVVYGIAKCTSVGQHTTQITGDVQSGSEYWWPKKLAAYSNTTLSSLIEQYPNVVDVFNTLPNPVGTDEKPGYPRENFRNCWCKMTAIGVPGAGGDFTAQAANGTIMSVSGGWVFARAFKDASTCAGYCMSGCAESARSSAKFRQNVLTVR